MKKILAVTLLLAMVFPMSITAKNIDPEDRVTLLEDDYAFTQEDLDKHFSDYTGDNSTLTLPTPNSLEEYSHVVGVVLNQKTNEPIPNAVVEISNEVHVTTDSDGRFQILNLPNGNYNWKITSDDYKTSYYKNYQVDALDGTSIFTFYLSEDNEINRDHNEYFAHDNQHVDLPLDSSTNQSKSMNSKPLTTLSVVVGIGNGEEPTVVGRQKYLYTVLSSELYSSSFYKSLGLSDLEINQLYFAHAVVSNSYLESALFDFSNHSKEGFDVCDTSCCQVYDPVKVTERAISAASICFERLGGYDYVTVIMYRPDNATYKYACTMFFSSCGNQGTRTRPGHPYMTGVPCTDLPGGEISHRYGLCQMGAAKCALDGDSYTEIIHHYYTDIEITSLRTGADK